MKKNTMSFFGAHCKSKKNFTNQFVHLLLPQNLFLKLKGDVWVVIYSPEISGVLDSELGVEFLPEFLFVV